MTVEQSSASGVYACPSCSTHFQIAAPQAAEPEPAPQPQFRKPMLSTPPLSSAPAQHQAPTLQRPGLPSYQQPTFAPKPSDKTIPIIVGSLAALCIVCVTFVVINSNKPEPVPAAPQVAAKPTQTDVRKSIEEKAQEMLDASAPSVERAVEKAKEEQAVFEEMQEERRTMLAEMYAEKIFDGDEKLGYQMVLAIEEVMKMMPESEDQAEKLLREEMTKNPALKPFIAKLDELPNSNNKKGPMAFLSQYKSFGTGFFIATDGWIVSNRHVVGTANEVDVRMSDGTTHRAKVVKKSDDFDLALIKVEAKAPQCLPVSKGTTDMGLGREVFTIGFPNPMLQGIEPKYTDGKVSATAGLGDDKNYYQVSVPVQPGNSGGALVDADTGWVVGVITLRLENTSDGRSAQNVSYAIKGSALHGFVEDFSKSGSERINIASTKPSSPNGIIELAKHSAVQILVPRDDKEDKEDEE
jgi:S1-C subfamily serine protease